MKGLLATLLIKLGLDSKEFKSGMNDAQNRTNKFGEYMKKIGGMIAGAFAVQKIIQFGKELIQIGGVAEGVRDAFMRIGDESTLKGLRDATKGTVSDLELMKRAVSASNLGLPIQNLASLFEFATKRAQDTGESVDYLVNSIVTGIGRKSPLILDNLGISAVQLKEKLKGVGMETASTADIARAVGEIAADSMKKSGAIIETNAIKVQQLKASWDNFKLSLSGSETLTSAASKALEGLRREVELLPESLQISAKALKLFFSNSRYVDKETQKAIDDISKSLDEFLKNQKKLTSAQEYYLNFIKLLNSNSVVVEKTIGDLKTETENLKNSIDGYGVSQTAEIQKTLAQIDANEKLIKTLTTLREKRDTTPISPISTLTSDVSVLPKGKYDDYNKIREKYGLKPIIEKEQLEFEKLNEVINSNTQKASDLYDKYFAEWENFKQDLAYSIADFGVNVVSELGMAFGELAKTGQFPSDFGQNVLSIIGNFISQLGKMLIGLGVASEAFQALLKSAFTNPISAGLAIAAGAALVLLGGAISGFAKAGPTGSTTGSSTGFSVSSHQYSAASSYGSNSGNNEIKLSAVLKGDNIYLSNQRNTYKRSVIG